MSNRSEYWAAKPPEEIVKACGTRIDSFFDWCRSSGRLALWSRMHRQYYAGLIEGGAMGTDGDNDELITVNCNDFRNLVQHLILFASSQRPKFDPRAANSDHKSQTQTILAEGILQYVLQEKGMERHIEAALEMCLLYGDGFLAIDWDATMGRDYARAPEGDAILKTGDIVFRSYAPLDMVRDFTKGSQDSHTWHIARDWHCRYDLAAKYPEWRSAIENMPSKLDPMKRPRSVNMFVNLYRYDTDDVEVFTLYHDRTPALPDGRMVRFILDGGDVPPFFDGPLPYDDRSLYQMSPAPMLGTAHGYSGVYDLLSLQEAENSLWTTLASNIAAFGVQNVWAMEGDNIDVSNLGGLKIIKSRSKPEGLNLAANSPDTYRLLEMIIHAAETISGVNSVARGNPEASLKSGSALALVQSQAIQFSLSLQKGWIRFLESAASGVIKIYRRFAKAPQVALLCGRANKGFVQEFTGEDLGRIERVSVDIGNPLMRTVSGRIEVAQMMLGQGLIKTPDELVMVLTTGQLEPVLEATQKEMLAIRAENEKLSEATPMPPPGVATISGPMPGPGMMPNMTANVIAVLTDNHPSHIREHAAVIASPESRENPQVVAAALAHIQEHIGLWETMPPSLAAALQIPPPPMAGPPPGMALLPPPGGGPPVGIPANPMPDGEGPLGPPDEGPKPRMPSMPANPMTGEKAPAAPGMPQ